MTSLDAYVRVSQVRGRAGDSFISPTVQRERIAAWAAAHGHRIARVHDEPDVSGATVDRPKLNLVMQRIEAGETGGVVVFKLDRFGRTLVDSLALIERIERAGGTFASVSDGFDLSTDTGRLVLRIMLSLAEFELDRIRGNWNDARERAVARGLHLTATVPFGYQRACAKCGHDAIEPGTSTTRPHCRDCGERGAGRLEAHPVDGVIVRELFERRAAGESWVDLRRFLEARGAKTSQGRDVWSLRAMRDILRNDVYLGVASHGKYRHEGAHDALTDPSTWRRAQRRGQQTTSKASAPALLTGLLRCAGCRYGMRASTRTLADGRIVHDYRCRCQSDHGDCAQPATATGAEGIDQLVVARYFERLHNVEVAPSVNGHRLAELQAERDAARDALDDFANDPRSQTVLGMERYLRGCEARQDALDVAQSAVDAEHDRVETLPLPADVGSLRADWSSFTVDEHRRLLGSAVDCVFVRQREGREALDERVFVCWRGEAPDELPGQGRRGYTPRAFLFPNPADAGVALAQDGDVRRGDGAAQLVV